jgi:hypothetical protein
MGYVLLLHFYTLYDQIIPTNTCSVGYISMNTTDHGNVWIPSCWMNYLTISGLIWYYLIVYKYCHINQLLATCMYNFSSWRSTPTQFLQRTKNSVISIQSRINLTIVVVILLSRLISAVHKPSIDSYSAAKMQFITNTCRYNKCLSFAMAVITLFLLCVAITR